MINDERIAEEVKGIQNLCQEYLGHPNPCAYTDSVLDLIIKHAENLQHLHDTNK